MHWDQLIWSIECGLDASMTRSSCGHMDGTGQLEQFHKHLNKQHPQIQFTREEESNNKVSFLDILVKREKVRFTTTVYTKPTNTGRYTPFFPHHHPRVKSGTIRCLAERGEKDIWYLIIQNLKEMKTQTRNNEQTEKPPHLFLPYVQGISKKIQVTCREMGVRTAYNYSGGFDQRKGEAINFEEGVEAVYKFYWWNKKIITKQ